MSRHEKAVEVNSDRTFGVEFSKTLMAVDCQRWPPRNSCSQIGPRVIRYIPLGVAGAAETGALLLVQGMISIHHLLALPSREQTGDSSYG